MKNFCRILRIALGYRWTVVTTLLLSLGVGLLWGLNIGTIYPFVEVVFKRQSLQQWVDEEITKAEGTAKELQQKIADLRQQQELGSADAQLQLQGEIDKLADRHSAELNALQGRQRVKPYIDRYLPTDPFHTLMLVVAVLLVGTLIKDVFLALSVVLCDRVTQLVALTLRKQLFRRTLQMDLGQFSQDRSSDLLSRFTHDLQLATTGVQMIFGKAMREPLKMAACFIGAGLICWRLLLLSLILAPLAAYLIGYLSKSLKRANRKAMQDMSMIYNVLTESFRGIKAVKAFTMEGHERRRFHETSKIFYHRAMRISFCNSLVRPATELMGICTISLAILGGAYLLLNQETHLLGIRMSERPLEIGRLLLFFGLLAGVSDPARKLSDVFSNIQRAAAAADRLYELLDREPTLRDPSRPLPLPQHQRDIVFQDVRFRYQEGEEVLRGINVTIPFGQTVALVGPNGCGKSTLANLVPRFFDPASGSILLDGVSLRDVRRRELRRQIGLVTQETLLFNETVEANIRYGRRNATRAEVIAAAQRAHAHEFITEKLPHDYDTVVGENANRLSGGQRQRIALARAILRDPRILILDEATSQVDLASEQLINGVLREFTRDRTTIVITHRPSTLELAERILVMDAGQIIDAGTHDELSARCQLYQRLYRTQFSEAA
jgi:ATP-binding cassette subfamily B protein/subfamily B ATP-binding cassette protein MsbA